MLRGYAPTLASIYTDPAFQDWLPSTMHFYRYLYENDHVHELSGIGHIRDEVMRVETKMTSEEIAEAKRMIGDRVMWLMDGAYWVKARARHSCYRSGMLIKSRAAEVRKLLKTLPEELRTAFTAEYPDISTPPAPRRKAQSPGTLPALRSHASNMRDKAGPSPSSKPPVPREDPQPVTPASAPVPAPQGIAAAPSVAGVAHRPWSPHGPRPQHTGYLPDFSVVAGSRDAREAIAAWLHGASGAPHRR
jgi:hypothetical protein